MITGYNTDVRHAETVVHVQTEDKGRGNPFIESVIYVAGRVVATKRSSYAQLLEGGKGDPEIAALMDHQHRTIVAAIRAGRFDGKLQGIKKPAGPAAAATAQARNARDPCPDPHADRRDSRAAGSSEGPVELGRLGRRTGRLCGRHADRARRRFRSSTTSTIPTRVRPSTRSFSTICRPRPSTNSSCSPWTDRKRSSRGRSTT